MVLFAISATVYDIFEVEIYMTLILTFRIPEGQILIHKSKANERHLLFSLYTQLGRRNAASLDILHSCNVL